MYDDIVSLALGHFTEDGDHFVCEPAEEVTKHAVLRVVAFVCIVNFSVYAGFYCSLFLFLYVFCS